jgi:predicted outer membrane protein
VHPVRHTILVTCIISCQGNATFLFAQAEAATLVSVSSTEMADENRLEQEELTKATDYFLSYSLQASPSKLSLAKLAATRGGCDEIRAFGWTVMKEEDDLAKKLKPLAAKRSIYPPFKLDENPPNEFSSLSAPEFDKKFVDQAILVLENDVKMLRRATECEDRWVRMLASERLPLVENQLAQLRIFKGKTAQCD